MEEDLIMQMVGRKGRGEGGKEGERERKEEVREGGGDGERERKEEVREGGGEGEMERKEEVREGGGDEERERKLRAFLLDIAGVR